MQPDYHDIAEDVVANPESQYNIGQTDRHPVDLGVLQLDFADDPALKVCQ